MKLTVAYKFVLASLLIMLTWPVVAQQRHVLMVSFDGFRHDYIKRWALPNFLRLQQEGSYATSLVPAFPSNTFPNHYTLVTGLYPGLHGLVDNTFYSRQQDEVYSMGNERAVTNGQYYEGIPLWQYTQQHGIKSASYFWVGSEARINGAYPDYFLAYNSRRPSIERIEKVFEWLSLDTAQRPGFITLYFSFVDSTSHNYGPLSAASRDVAQQADKLLGQIIRNIDRLAIEVDLIVVSDHGMLEVELQPDRIINLQALGVNSRDAVIISSQTKAMYYVRNENNIETVYQKLKSQQQHFSVFRKDELPANWHYSDHPHIGDIVLLARDGYVLARNSEQLADIDTETIGVHGYPATDSPDLHGIFLARGPHIKKGIVLPPVENIHVYPLITRLLQLPDNLGIDGDPEVLSPILE